MVQQAKNLSMNPGDSNAATNWRKANQAVSNNNRALHYSCFKYSLGQKLTTAQLRHR